MEESHYRSHSIQSEDVEKESKPNTSPNRSQYASTTDLNHNHPPVEIPDDTYLTGFKLYVLFISLLFTVLMIALDAAIISTAIPRITDDFGTIANVGWYGSSYMIANACLQPLTGKIYNYFPLKSTFFVFVAVFEFGSIVCAVAKKPTALIVGRSIAGMGSSGLANGSITLIGDVISPNRRPTINGIIMSMFGVGQVVGPLIGGALTQHASWRWSFWINLPIGIVSVLGMLAIQLPPGKERAKVTYRRFIQDLDLVGFALFAPASVLLLLALQWGGIKFEWASGTIIGLLIGSGAVYIAFVSWESHQGDSAMFPSVLLRQPVISCSLAVSFLFGGSLILLAYYLPMWFQVVKHASPTDSAVYTLPTFISQIIFASISGPLSTRIGFFTPLAITGAALSAIGTGLMSTFTPDTSTGKWIGYQILCGAGRGLGLQQPVNTVQATLSKSQLSTGMAIVIWSQFFGGAVVLALGQTAFSQLLRKALSETAPTVDPSSLINAGATDYVLYIPAKEQSGVLEAYNRALVGTFYLPTAVVAVAAFVALGMGWKKIVSKGTKIESEGEKATI